MDKLKLINNVLIQVSGQRISSLSDDDHLSHKANAAYERSVLDMLNEHSWSFLVKDELLTEDIGTDSTLYQYKYLIPDKFEKFLGVLSDTFSRWQIFYYLLYDFPDVAFEYELRDKYFYTNVENVKFIYQTSDIETALVPSGFQSALIAGMESYLAISLLQSPSLMQIKKQIYLMTLRKAVMNDLTQMKRHVAKERGLSGSDFRVF